MNERTLTTLFDYEGANAAAFSVLPPSIIPVLFLSGTDFQMGYQYGQQAGPYIEMLKAASWVQVLQDQSRKEILNSLDRFRYYIDKYTPEAMEQMEGMVAGAKEVGVELSLEDVMVINCMPKKLIKPDAIVNGKTKKESPIEECSVFAAWGSATADGKLVFGDSKDSIFNHQVLILAFPDKGNSYMTGVRAGELSEHFAMSNRGLFIGTGSNPSKRDIDLGYGLHKQFFIQHILRFTQNATEAKDRFLSWDFPNRTNFIFADVQGQAYVVERTAAAKPVRTPGDHGEVDFIYSTNTAMTDEMKAGVNGQNYIEHAGWDVEGSAIPRSLEIWNMLNNYRGKIDIEFVKMMWRFNENPHPLALSKTEFRMKRDQKICHRENMRVVIGLPDDGDKGVVYVCTGPAGRILHPPTERHRDCFQIAGTHTFYKLILASSPDKVVRASREDAHDFLTEAHRGLMAIKYSDAGYGYLQALITQATAEYYDGVQAYHKGNLAKDNEALLHLARAATAFTRSQAHARQLTHALVPPATRPEDLGLNSYEGAWGEWAAR